VPAAVEAKEPVVVGQMYDLGGRFEIMLTPSMSVFDKYTQHYATSLGLAYFLNDYIGFEVDGGYAFISGDKKLLTAIVDNGADTLDQYEITKLPLSDLKYMKWWAGGGFVFNPLYGKLNLSAELAVSFHLYLVAGGGVAQFNYHELSFANPNLLYEKVTVDVGVKPVFYFGGGLRFHINKTWSMRVELRDIVLKDTYRAQKPGTTATAENITIDDFVHTNLVRLSACYAF
jgi:outer membrane beta-barrel protein